MTTALITPSVGRKVWYFRDAQQIEPIDATIIKVWAPPETATPETVVNLLCVDPLTGETFIATSVPVRHDDSTVNPVGACYRWMPYQQKQAEKEVRAAPFGDAEIEREIKAKGLTAPRVTLEDMDANIADVEIVKHVSKTGKVLRWAVITTRNGFAVVGKPSAAVSIENDRADLGEKMAIENARNELWPLMGYELQSKLAG